MPTRHARGSREQAHGRELFAKPANPRPFPALAPLAGSVGSPRLWQGLIVRFSGAKRTSAKACRRAETSVVLRAVAFFFVAILGEVPIDDSAALLVCLLAGLARRSATDRRRLIARAAE